MPLKDGQSELDTAVVRHEGVDYEIRTWEDFSVDSDFPTPTDKFEFGLSTNDPTKYNAIFIPGAKISIVVNNKPQMTGFIDRVTRTRDRNKGLSYRVVGRDILGPVVSATIDDKIKITSNQTVADFLYAILGQSGISSIDVGDEFNYNIATGYRKGQSGGSTQRITVKEAKSRAVSEDGKSAEVIFDTKTVFQTVSRNRPDLKKLPLDQLKPKLGEGAFQLIERILTRLGLRMWAKADGSGVVVDAPDFETPAIHKVIQQFDGSANNVISSALDENGGVQPSCVVATGKSGGKDLSKTKLKVIAVNELTSVYSDKKLVRVVSDIIARYPGIRVLPFRDQLIPKQDRVIPIFHQKPMFFRDDDSKNIDQLSAVARKKLSTFQKEYFVADYTVMGHTYNGYPWRVNTLVDVDDDYLGIHEPLWVISRTFLKGRGGGTTTRLRLIRPFTYELGA